MKAIWIITKRELQSFFDSLIAYILMVAFLGFCGFFTWLFGADIFIRGQASLDVFFNFSAFWALLVFIPALTMRLLAEEIKTGTIELLLTKSISDRELVLGKFFATLLLIIITLLFTIPYVITIANIGNLDNGGVLCGNLALILMSAAYISIGMFTSSITNNQIVAFLSSLLICLFFHIIFELIASGFTGSIGGILQYLSLFNHYESITRGVIDSKDIVYFLSLIVLGLFLTEWSLSKRNVS